MPVSDWTIEPPHISTLYKGFHELPPSVITPEVHVKLETANPDCEIFFSTDGSTPDPLNIDVLSAARTYRYKSPFKLKPGSRTVNAVCVSRSSGAKSELSFKTFDVVEVDGVGKKQYTSDTQIYADRRHQGGDTFRVPEMMNHRNQHHRLYDGVTNYNPRAAPRSVYIDPVSSSLHQGTTAVDPEISEFFSTHNTQHRIANLPQTVSSTQQIKTQLYDDVRSSAPYIRNGPGVTPQSHRLAQSTAFESNRRPRSPTLQGQGHTRSFSPTDPRRKSPAYEMRRNAYLESQVAVHDKARREQAISDHFQPEDRPVDLETDEEHLLAELERKYEAEKARQTSSSEYDSEVTPRYSDIIGPETSRLLDTSRVRFEKESHLARARLEEDMKQRDVLADMTGNQLRYSTRSSEPHLSGRRSRSRTRSRSPGRRSTQFKTTQPYEEMQAPRETRNYSDRDQLEHLLVEQESARSRHDLESLSELENEIEAYRRSLAKKQPPPRSRSRSFSPQRRRELPGTGESPVPSELDDIFTARESRREKSDRFDGRGTGVSTRGEKGEMDKADTEKMEKMRKKDCREQEKKDDKDKKDKKKKKSNLTKSDSSGSDSDSSSSSSSGSSEKSDKKSDKKKDKNKKKSPKEENDKKSKDKEKLKPVCKPVPKVSKTPKSSAAISGKPKAPVTPRMPSTPVSSSRVSTARSIDTPRSETSKTSSVQPSKQAIKLKAVQKPQKEPTQADSALNFMNDSGTQINFWGAPPKEVLDSMKGMFPQVIPVTNQNGVQSPRVKAARIAGVQRSGVMQQPQIEELVDSDSEQSDLSDWFSPTRGTTPGYRLQPQQQPQKPGSVTLKPSTTSNKPLKTTSLSQTAPAKLDTSPPTVAPSRGGPVSATQQTEQESISGFFKKLFKTGWGSSEKSEKSKDPRKSVRTVGDQSGVTFQQLKTEAEKKGQLFEDPEFPCEDKSLYFSEKPVSGKVEWKRPHEICSNPEMFVGGASRFDIMQGVLGNCWLLAAMSSLTTDQKLLYKVVPQDQSFSKDYTGIFRFCIWQYGQWLEVFIDDRLPTYKGKLIYMHSTDNNEFWSPLLEKAYAKLVGCYENLTGGLQSEAMTDFTGGVCERYNFREEMPDNMFQILHKARQRGALMGCSIDAGTFKAQALPGKTEEELENGLIVGHAYSITDVKQLESSRGVVQLVRCRNPWGTEHEWNGAWSDQSSEWQNISDKDKKQLGLKFEHDGEFWMDFRDFSANFQRVEICNLSPDDIMDDSDDNVKWKCQTLQGCWKKKVNAGGCRNFPKTFHTNPQYRVELIDVDDDDEEDIATLIVALMQKGRRQLRQSGQGNLTIGYEIYDVSDASSGNLSRDFFRDNAPVASAPQYINMREVVGRHRLPPSKYCIVPTTFEPNEEADLVIRAFTESEVGEVIESDEVTCYIQPKTTAVVQSAAHMTLTSEADEQFEAHGGQKDGEIDANELKEILDTVFTKDFNCGPFHLPLCRSLVTSRDSDGQGTLSLEEFRKLWDDLTQLKNTFKHHDENKSQRFDSLELRDALRTSGFPVSNATFKALVSRYSDKDGNVMFDDFVECVLKLRQSLACFECQKSATETAQFNKEEFVQMSICA